LFHIIYRIVMHIVGDAAPETRVDFDFGWGVAKIFLGRGPGMKWAALVAFNLFSLASGPCRSLSSGGRVLTGAGVDKSGAGRG